MPFGSELTNLERGESYGDPMRLWAHAYVPRDLKKLFQWSEYLFYNSAQIYAGIRKFSEYPITELTYITENPILKGQYKKLLEDVLGIKRILIRSSLDLHVYGNSFTSVHFPFKRFIICDRCDYKTDINHADFTVSISKLAFRIKCPECGSKEKATIEDKRILDPKKINVIRWDPKLIDIAHNDLTNESEYYLNIPAGIEDSIRKGDRHLLKTMPMSVLKTISKKKIYKFDKNEIYHMKADSPAGVESGWGYPPLISTMHLFYHASILRKANESIALDRIVPMRILHPSATSANADPIVTLSISSWVSDMKTNIRKWRQDPNHIMLAPVALGVSQLGGDGRALMVDSEIARAEDNIIAGMGFPKEFIYGGLSFTGSSVTLRMLENQLESSVFQIDNLLQWITDKAGTYIGWKSIEVRLGDFKMVDDVQQKQLAMTLWQGGVISKTTLAEAHGLDLDEERKKMQLEQLQDAALQRDISKDLSQLENTMADQAKAEAQQGAPQGGGLTYDQQAVIAQADQIAQQLMQMHTNSRRSQLSSLSKEDYVMYSVVIQRLEQLQLDTKNQAAQQVLSQMGVG